MAVPRRATAIATGVAGVAIVAVGTAVVLGAVGGTRPGRDDSSVHFTASGDFSTTPNAFRVLDGIGEIGADLHLALGDLSYSTSMDERDWCKLVTDRVGAGFAFELVAGNHESDGENGDINDFSACLPNQLPGLVGTYGRQYYVDVPAEAPLVRYIMISPALEFPGEPEWTYERGSGRYAWTEAAIDGAREADVPWVVVGMHKPCLSMGEYPCDPGSDLINLLTSKRVDLVLSGHEHLYQRSHQLALTSACPRLVPEEFTAACVVDEDSTMTKGAGTVFATVGTGGVPFRDADPADADAGYYASHSALNANPTWGSLELTATSSELDASFVRAAGGDFGDRFRLTAAPRK